MNLDVATWNTYKRAKGRGGVLGVECADRWRNGVICLQEARRFDEHSMGKAWCVFGKEMHENWEDDGVRIGVPRALLPQVKASGRCKYAASVLVGKVGIVNAQLPPATMIKTDASLASQPSDAPTRSPLWLVSQPVNE